MPYSFCAFLWIWFAMARFFVCLFGGSRKEIIHIQLPLYLSDAKENVCVDLKFALPGRERQDSVYSGLQVGGYCFNDAWAPLNLVFKYAL